MGLWTKNVAIDLGTANTIIYVKGRGIVVREPSVVAIDRYTGKVVAAGEEANKMIGRTPDNIIAIRPMKDGVIADFDITQAMIKHFIRKAKVVGILKPRVVVCIPSGITEVERRAVEEAVIQAGAKEVALIEEPMAAAIGAGLPVTDATGNMVVDIGGGTSEVAVISLGDIVTAQSIRTAGDDLDAAIINFIRKKHNLLIGERTAEQIKIEIGSALPFEGERSIEIKGRNLVDGLPKNVMVSAEEVREAITEPVMRIIDAIKLTLEKTPPELAADIIDTGITLTGGGALLRGLSQLIADEIGMPVTVAANPLDCVVLGTAKRLEAESEFENYTFKRGKRYR
jgi:rod shape-determining protein MreB